MPKPIFVAGLFLLGALFATWVSSSQPTQVIEAQEKAASTASDDAVREMKADIKLLQDKAADKPYLRPKIPDRPAESSINFDPQAPWPK